MMTDDYCFVKIYQFCQKWSINHILITFYIEKHVVINIENFPTYDDDNNKRQNNILISASNIEKNIFEIEKNGRQVFYEKLNPTACQQCKIAKNEKKHD